MRIAPYRGHFWRNLDDVSSLAACITSSGIRKASYQEGSFQLTANFIYQYPSKKFNVVFSNGVLSSISYGKPKTVGMPIWSSEVL